MKICKKIGIFTFDFGQMIEQNMSGAINISGPGMDGKWENQFQFKEGIFCFSSVVSVIM